MEKNSTEYKQNYLRTEILESGYDGEDFSEYINTNFNEKGLNVDNWTFEELYECVEQYKKSKINNENNENNLQNENNDLKENLNNNIIENKPDENNEEKNEENNEEKIPEQKSQNKIFDFFEKNKNN